MQGKYQAILFHPDGEKVTDFSDSETVQDVWERINDMGSRWIFYPICFVGTDKTIIEAPEGLEFLQGKRIKTVRRMLAERWETHADFMCKVLNDGWPLHCLLED